MTGADTTQTKTTTPTRVPTVDMPSDLLTVRGLVAEWPGLGERWIRGCVDERRIPVHKLAGRILVSRADFVDWIESGRIEPAES